MLTSEDLEQMSYNDMKTYIKSKDLDIDYHHYKEKPEKLRKAILKVEKELEAEEKKVKAKSKSKSKSPDKKLSKTVLQKQYKMEDLKKLAKKKGINVDGMLKPAIVEAIIAHDNGEVYEKPEKKVVGEGTKERKEYEKLKKPELTAIAKKLDISGNQAKHAVKADLINLILEKKGKLKSCSADENDCPEACDIDNNVCVSSSDGYEKSFEYNGRKFVGSKLAIKQLKKKYEGKPKVDKDGIYVPRAGEVYHGKISKNLSNKELVKLLVDAIVKFYEDEKNSTGKTSPDKQDVQNIIEMWATDNNNLNSYDLSDSIYQKIFEKVSERLGVEEEDEQISGNPEHRVDIDGSYIVRTDSWYYGTIPKNVSREKFIDLMVNAIVKFKQDEMKFAKKPKPFDRENVLDIIDMWSEHNDELFEACEKYDLDSMAEEIFKKANKVLKPKTKSNSCDENYACANEEDVCNIDSKTCVNKKDLPQEYQYARVNGNKVFGSKKALEQLKKLMKDDMSSIKSKSQSKEEERKTVGCESAGCSDSNEICVSDDDAVVKCLPKDKNPQKYVLNYEGGVPIYGSKSALESFRKVYESKQGIHRVKEPEKTLLEKRLVELKNDKDVKHAKKYGVCSDSEFSCVEGSSCDIEKGVCVSNKNLEGYEKKFEHNGKTFVGSKQAIKQLKQTLGVAKSVSISESVVESESVESDVKHAVKKALEVESKSESKPEKSLLYAYKMTEKGLPKRISKHLKSPESLKKSFAIVLDMKSDSVPNFYPVDKKTLENYEIVDVSKVDKKNKQYSDSIKLILKDTQDDNIIGIQLKSGSKSKSEPETKSETVAPKTIEPAEGQEIEEVLDDKKKIKNIAKALKVKESQLDLSAVKQRVRDLKSRMKSENKTLDDYEIEELREMIALVHGTQPNDYKTWGKPAILENISTIFRNSKHLKVEGDVASTVEDKSVKPVEKKEKKIEKKPEVMKQKVIEKMKQEMIEEKKPDADNEKLSKVLKELSVSGNSKEIDDAQRQVLACLGIIKK